MSHTHPHPHTPSAVPQCGCAEDIVSPTPTSPRGHADSGQTFKISGLDCAEEMAVLRREIGPLVGGDNHLSFDILNGRMIVADGAGPVSADLIQAAVARTGMHAEVWQAGKSSAPDEDHRRRLHALLMMASGGFVALGMLLHSWIGGGFGAALGVGVSAQQGVPLPSIIAYAIAIALGGRFVVVKAWYAAKRLQPDMNFLMTVAVIGAIVLGDWLEAATVAFLFALSLALEGWSVGRARRAIAALLELAPLTVRIVDDSGIEREVPAAEVSVGARFIVKPGERVPLDGRVIKGVSALNQAPITGESVPVTKEPGSDVFAGTINGEGALDIASTKRAEDTTLANIIKLVEAAQSRRSRAEQWVESFAKIYTPTVIAVAAAVAMFPPLLIGGLWDIWVYRALILLVIACPCALVISTPVSIVAALASAARAGILVKGGAFLEVPARLKAIAFDKTGTLTVGRPVVISAEPLNDHSEQELLARAAALEVRSAHPLARAIVDYAIARGVAIVPVDSAQMFPGKGVTGMFEGRNFWLGSHRYVEERGQETAGIHDRIEALERQGRTVVVIGNDTHICGLIAIADTIRPEAARTLQALRRAGIEHLVMLTGDNKATAESIAGQADINEVRAELLPADKVDAVLGLVTKYHAVAMIGDGVNDAPAMASASLGIAMGAAGSDAAIEAADIALMSDDLSKLPWLVHHSRRTLSIIRQNIVFSLAVKVTFALLTFVGLASLWGAIAADVGASLIVVANGLRLLRDGPPPSRDGQQ